MYVLYIISCIICLIANYGMLNGHLYGLRQLNVEYCKKDAIEDAVVSFIFGFGMSLFSVAGLLIVLGLTELGTYGFKFDWKNIKEN